MWAYDDHIQESKDLQDVASNNWLLNKQQLVD